MKAKITLSLCAILLASLLSAQTYGEIRGIVKSKDLEPVAYATIKVLQGTQLITGTQTDEDGKYSCKPLNPGSYELVIIHTEYRTQTIRKINVNPSEATYVDAKLETHEIGVVDVIAEEIDYTHTGVDVDVFHTKSFSATDLMQNASYVRGDVKNALAFMTAEVVQDAAGELHVRGARAGATGYFIDGVRTMEVTSVPALAIENISAFTGGVPAMYGDLTSGAVMVTTKTYFSGIRDKNMRHSEMMEQKREAAARKKAEEDEANRAREIEAEKAKDKMKKD